MGKADGDGAWRGLVMIVELKDPRPYIFQTPVYGSLMYTVIHMSDHLLTQIPVCPPQAPELRSTLWPNSQGTSVRPCVRELRVQPQQHRHGRAVQVDPIKPVLKAPGSILLKLRCDDGLLSKVAFDFNLRRYNADCGDAFCCSAENFAGDETTVLGKCCALGDVSCNAPGTVGRCDLNSVEARVER